MIIFDNKVLIDGVWMKLIAENDTVLKFVKVDEEKNKDVNPKIIENDNFA